LEPEVLVLQGQSQTLLEVLEQIQYFQQLQVQVEEVEEVVLRPDYLVDQVEVDQGEDVVVQEQEILHQLVHRKEIMEELVDLILVLQLGSFQEVEVVELLQ
jgi:hypothetical protein